MSTEAHITFQIVSETKSDFVTFPGQQIEVRKLKELINQKLGIIKNEYGGQIGSSRQYPPQEMIVYDATSKIEYPDNEKIRTNSKVLIERRSRTNEQSYSGVNSHIQCRYCKDTKDLKALPCCFNKVCVNCQDKRSRYGKCPMCLTSNNGPFPKQSLTINKQQLDIMSSNARFFIIRSSNQENINLAKELGKWATTKANEGKLDEAYQNSQNVILFFRFNQKDQNFQGCARMESKALKNPDYRDYSNQIQWKKQERINLGGNFSIKWLRVGPILDQKTIYQMKNSLTQNFILTSRDCQEVGGKEGKQICMLFEHPPENINISQEFTQTIDQSQSNNIMNQLPQIDNNQLQQQNKQKEEVKQKKDEEEDIEWDELLSDEDDDENKGQNNENSDGVKRSSSRKNSAHSRKNSNSQPLQNIEQENSNQQQEQQKQEDQQDQQQQQEEQTEQNENPQENENQVADEKKEEEEIAAVSQQQPQQTLNIFDNLKPSGMDLTVNDPKKQQQQQQQQPQSNNNMMGMMNMMPNNQMNMMGMNPMGMGMNMMGGMGMNMMGGMGMQMNQMGQNQDNGMNIWGAMLGAVQMVMKEKDEKKKKKKKDKKRKKDRKKRRSSNSRSRSKSNSSRSRSRSISKSTNSRRKRK